MNRLTYWTNKEKGFALPVPINDDGDTVDLETICARLAAYEDACLEPEGYKAFVEVIRRLDIEHMHDLLVAEQEGRLVVLPKNYAEIYDMRGDFAWVIDDGEITEVIVTDVSLNDKGIPTIDCGYMGYRWAIEGGVPVEKDVPVDCSRPISEVGKTVFLTREEAKAALEKQKGGEGNG